MAATHYRLGQMPHGGAGARLESGAEDDFAGARRRLTFAVLWLAGLMGWGLFSYLTEQPAADHGERAARAEQQLDGHGKWTGQTADWRSRSQILQDAGVVGRD